MKIERVFEKLWDWRNDIVMEDEVEKAIESYALDKQIEVLEELLMTKQISNGYNKCGCNECVSADLIGSTLADLKAKKGER
jgi:hypothetical protein